MLRGAISGEQMRCLTLLNQNDEPFQMVIKECSTTGVAISRFGGIFSLRPGVL